MSSPSKSRLRFQPILPGDTGRLAGVLSGFILLLAVLPILTMIVMSFSGASNLDFPPSSYSLQWYKAAWNTFVSPDASDVLSLGKAMTTSLWVACLTMVLATLVAVPASYALTRCEFRGKGVALQLMSLPLVFPMVVLGLALLLIFDSLPFQMNTSRLVIAHVILALPFVVKNCTAAMMSIGSEVEEAAQMLGASPLRAIVDVVVPLMKSGILAGMLLAFIVSFNEFTVTYFLYNIDVMTVPIWMYSRTVSSLDPTVFSFAVLIVLIDFVLIWALEKLVGEGGVSF
ncbi:ABC transporter permease [Pseudomonas sp. RTC3]|mgnify:CR=1 FL=1|jgi:putative spermidine/putrescine transport system permease protein|uniref:ABC transporter permease n=1 Tax=unclassified Pseudomonas TaxID=196821 RepID=UPI001C55AC47|nr:MULTISPECIES: ABC transporter permease [unclassified Pseudomonas]MEB0062315.1 ABC transporter permease [Pseudomonas sp. RTC3]MDY7566311.1 ABC transporter permease [Pseudomonas sp. 5C2]MEB0009256.1 ABC transporter permease [Pseudomonas sp. RTB2]MEB0017776.1 ABC transporter permease [Pseudomonas sp. RTB3]MEB0024569.1 ABC transporter permease [Pseudomonas sp. MH9.2]